MRSSAFDLSSQFFDPAGLDVINRPLVGQPDGVLGGMIANVFQNFGCLLMSIPSQKFPNHLCPECGCSLQWFLVRLCNPRPGEPSVCGHCGALTILTGDLRLRRLDWPDWCLLTHA